MWAYVDETGNTGNRIFDSEQPLFITAAMLTKTNFDVLYKSQLKAIASKVGGVALHAGELGVAKIELIAEDLLGVVKRADARFFVSRLEKRYLAATKVYDTYFDAGENLAVPWHVYWIKPLRLTMMFKLSQFVITEEVAAAVWECMTAPTEAKSKAAFLRGAEEMLRGVHNLPDARSREVATEAFEWALRNPENFTTHIRDKVSRYGHSPNFVAFTNLMRGLDDIARTLGRPVREIIHDQQDQFERTLQQWHGLFARPDIADQEPLHWPGDPEPRHVGQVSGSAFTFKTEEQSPGLQVIDVILWLFKRTLTGRDIGSQSERLLQRVFLRGKQNDLSFAGVGHQLNETMDSVMNSPMPDEQLATGNQMVARHNEDRLAAMKRYAEDKAQKIETS